MCDARAEKGSSEAYTIELIAAVRRVEALTFVKSVGQISLTSKQNCPGFQARMLCKAVCGKSNVTCQVKKGRSSLLQCAVGLLETLTREHGEKCVAAAELCKLSASTAPSQEASTNASASGRSRSGAM